MFIYPLPRSSQLEFFEYYWIDDNGINEVLNLT
jgi:hypothetical protein